LKNVILYCSISETSVSHQICSLNPDVFFPELFLWIFMIFKKKFNSKNNIINKKFFPTEKSFLLGKTKKRSQSQFWRWIFFIAGSSFTIRSHDEPSSSIDHIGTRSKNIQHLCWIHFFGSALFLKHQILFPKRKLIFISVILYSKNARNSIKTCCDKNGRLYREKDCCSHSTTRKVTDKVGSCFIGAI